MGGMNHWPLPTDCAGSWDSVLKPASKQHRFVLFPITPLSWELLLTSNCCNNYTLLPAVSSKEDKPVVFTTLVNNIQRRAQALSPSLTGRSDCRLGKGGLRSDREIPPQTAQPAAWSRQAIPHQSKWFQTGSLKAIFLRQFFLCIVPSFGVSGTQICALKSCNPAVSLTHKESCY